MTGSNADETRDTHPHPENEGAPQHRPNRIARYLIEKLLGKGSFGLVYLAHDEQLDRPVAVKVPHATLISQPEDAEAYLAEARTVANLDHPGIVPVYDVGSTEDCSCYVVSKYIEGTALSTRIKESRLEYTTSAELVATVAEALHYAHKQGLVHRDVKPGNILIDCDDKPYVVDFGLALREDNFGKGPNYAGTPAYMSPEQARGEGHRVDGRSDTYSLGGVLYEMLTGRRTFSADTQLRLLEQIATHEPKPPRQIEDSIPKELERICLRALSNRASERYTTALDMAEDLRDFLQAEPPASVSPPARAEPAAAADLTRAGRVSAMAVSTSDSEPLRIVPKGLRSFDEHDADFFLELLPGPRDRDGLPDSVRFWKTRIEEMDADATFSVGLIYGPSGCGKSSLVKAGLLPRLSSHVTAIYVESTADDTEAQLLGELRKRHLAPEGLGLIEALAALRRGHGLAAGYKVLVVLDQFEQWLHAKGDREHTELVGALRQCDGGNVQCVVMVRDDFWMAVTRFLGQVEVDLLQGMNFVPIDLFHVRHARRVLACFGRAYGALPDDPGETSDAQRQFLRDAVDGLAGDGKVVCVRLALFAEMMKGRSWSPAALSEVGGTSGIGVTFLEETFSSHLNPKYRLHQTAAQAVLKSLLPEAGADIKGHMRSADQLRESSGYAHRPRDFVALLKMLDSELRLITPGHLEGAESLEDHAQPSSSNKEDRYYQLTHDYLVPALREWLTRKQRETRRGRAELRLAERATHWNAKPEHRNLPSMWEYLNISGLTARDHWREPQRKMMRRAAQYYLCWTVVVLVALVVVVWGARQTYSRSQARTLMEALLQANVDDVNAAAERIDTYRRWTEPRLSALLGNKPANEQQRRQQLHARIALVPRDTQQVRPLMEQFYEGPLPYIGAIAEALRPHREQIEAGLWRTLQDASQPVAKRFRCGVALAMYSPQSDRWSASDAALIVQQLVASNPEFQPRLRRHLRDVAPQLLSDLERAFRDHTAGATRRLGAANALAEYAPEETARLATLLVEADAAQFQVLYPLVTDSLDTAANKFLETVATEAPNAAMSHDERLALGQRRGGAAIARLRQGDPDTVLKALRVDDDPEALSQFVHRCRALGVTLPDLLDCLEKAELQWQGGAAREPRVATGVLYGLLLALGEFQLSDLPEQARDALSDRVADWYANDPRSAIHGASGWLLRQWKLDEVARQVDATPIPYSPDRDWFTQEITALATVGDVRREQSFSLTFVVFLPGDYAIGSPPDEPNRDDDEIRHVVKITRPFAILDREITAAEVLAFDPEFSSSLQQSLRSAPSRAIAGANWYQAISFCRWLGQQAGLSEDDQPYPDPITLNTEDCPPDPVEAAEGFPKNWPVRLDRAGFRLPTEAEWEIACRGGVRTMFGFGGDLDLLQRYAWYLENSGGVVHHPKELRPNHRGLFDMHGNMMEWCHDWYGGYSLAGEANTLGPKNGTVRVYRGGGWIYPSRHCGSAVRMGGPPSLQSNRMGFRIVLSPTANRHVSE